MLLISKKHLYKSNQLFVIYIYIYVIPLKEAQSNSIWNLEKCTYGLCYNTMKTHLKASRSDPSLFYFINESIIGYIPIHVGDIIWAGTDLFDIDIIDKLSAKSKIGKENPVQFCLLGLDITSNNSTRIKLSQTVTSCN